MNGLGQNGVPVAMYEVRSTANQQDFAVGTVLRKVVKKIDTAHPRHHDIGDHSVRRECRQDFNGFFGTVCNANPVAS